MPIDESRTAGRAPTTGPSVEQVLWFVDRQIEAVVNDGPMAVRADLADEEGPGPVPQLAALPADIAWGVIERVTRSTSSTRVRVRYGTGCDEFVMFTTWRLGPEDRPWIVGLQALRALLPASGGFAAHRLDSHTQTGTVTALP